MADDYILHKVLDKIKRKDIEKLDDTKILIDTDDKLLSDITLEDVLILMTCIIKDGDNFINNYF